MVADTNNHLYISGRLRDMLTGVDALENPFLYHLPQLLLTQDFKLVNPSDAVTFTEMATKYEKMPLILDALKILNRLVDPVDGSLLVPSRDMFYENRSFFWKELGNRTGAADVIMHVFNKTIFFSSLGKK
jgi:hypothetical protein